MALQSTADYIHCMHVYRTLEAYVTCIVCLPVLITRCALCPIKGLYAVCLFGISFIPFTPLGFGLL